MCLKGTACVVNEVLPGGIGKINYHWVIHGAFLKLMQKKSITSLLFCNTYFERLQRIFEEAVSFQPFFAQMLSCVLLSILVIFGYKKETSMVNPCHYYTLL